MTPWRARLASYAAPHWRAMLGVGLLMLAVAAMDAMKPWPMKLLVDYVFPGRPLPDALAWLTRVPGGSSSAGLCAWLAASTLLVFTAAWALQTVQAYLQSGLALRITYNLAARLLEHLQRLSLRYHNRQPTGDLVRRVTQDSRCARDLALDVAAPALTSLITLVTMFAVMWQLDSLSTVVALLIIPGLIGADRLFYRPMMERTYEQQQCEGQMMSQAERALAALPVVQAFRREAHEESQFRQTASRTLGAYFRALAAQLKFNFAVGGASAVGRATVMVLGGYRVLQGHLTLGDMLVFYAYVTMLYAPLDTLTHLAAALAGCQARARRVFEVLDMDDFVPEGPEGGAGPSARSWQGHVRFDNVDFAYESGRLVLRGIRLEVQGGECVAVVGQTGAGKSTLMSLLMRFFDPCAGRITLDGVDLREIPLTTLRAQIAILLQEPFLLPVSIAENIAYGRPTASRREIEAAAEAANAQNFIRRLPQGYDTVIGQRGATLSGGERQRIAIARALLKNGPVLILDEPTSALDAATENEVMDAVARLMAGRTTFIIAHRLSTARRADRIVVLEQGAVVEDGSPADLELSRGAYHRFLTLQARPLAPRP